VNHYPTWNQQGVSTCDHMTVAEAEQLTALWERGGPNHLFEPLTQEEVELLQTRFTKEQQPNRKKTNDNNP